MSDLAAALQIAIKVHADQRDKQGEPYLWHVLRVVEAVSGERAKVLAALHDVVEEGYEGDLEDAFGENGMWIANSVEVLTRTPSQTYAEYIEDIRAGHSSTWVALIREVKLADLRDHLAHMPSDGSLDSLKPRYERALAVLENAG